MRTKEKIKKLIDEMDDQVNVLETKVENLKGTMKADYKDKLSALKVKRDEFRASYEKLADATEEKWEETREVFVSASESFKEGFNKLKSLFE